MKFNCLFLASLTLFSRVVPVYAQQAPTTPVAPIQLPAVTVTAPELGGYAATPVYGTTHAYFGPLGNQSIKDTPFSMTVIPEDMMVNAGVTGVNQALRYLPSVEVRDQQGDEVSRPQSRGFQGGIFQNTRLDGMNIIGTTAIPTENLSGIEVLNGLGSSLYGPETAAGVFNYILKRPTDTPLYRFTESYDSKGLWTEAADISGRVGPDGISPDGAIGYRFNLVHGEGEDYTTDSNVNRTLISGDFDFHIDPKTVVELDLSHYETDTTGLPGGIIYGSKGTSTMLPAAVNPDTPGLGQPFAGSDLTTDTAALKLKHQFNDNWSGEVGGLYQNAIRGLYGIEDEMTNNTGEYTAVQNWSAVPHFTIASWTASLNGHFNVLGMKNDLSIGANGFSAGEDSYRNPNAFLVTLGTSNLANPTVFGAPATPNAGGEYESATISQDSLIVGDTLHFNSKWALQGVLSASFINAKSFGTTGQTTNSDEDNGALSPTVSLIYKPTSAVTTYATFSNSVEEGDQAPAGTANVNQFMAPYHDREYEAGVKYAPTDSLLVTADGFDMTRPLAETNATANVFGVVGTQRNIGAELFVQGEILPSLSVLGGLTYVDAQLIDSASSSGNGGRVVGVPAFKGDLALDYHPGFAEGFAFTGAVHYESSRAASDTNLSYAPSYVTLDLGVRYSTALLFRHHVTARLQLLNVTNRYYYVSIADGNDVGVAGSNTAFLGAPRTLMGSVELDF
ncbi:TonB-dependent receptor [Paraburkholderia sp. RL18-085-BIA-A]|uniref:TonB-dependent receptor n=1 Tax=Paraburkholderia sp. RL18-085-BIA-A TaxID=3031633 RepID=UPI0038BAAFCE